MNKKRINIILIPLAIILWIMVMIRVFSYTKPKQITEAGAGTFVRSDNPVASRDTLRLLLNYPDPFSDSRSLVTLNTPSEEQKAKEKTFFVKPAEPVIPKVSYSGLVESGDKGRKVGLVTVNGKSLLLTKNDTVDGLRVTECWRDSVTFTAGDRTITVKK